MRIVVVEAGLGTPSSTRLLADRLTAATAEMLAGQDLEFSTIALRELAHPLADNLLTGFPSGPLVPAIEAVAAADALIVVTPVFAASYSGLFKMFFDVLEPGALRGTPVLLAATAGTARHSLVLEHAVRPLLSYLGALTVPTAVFAATEDWGAAGVGALDERIARAATDLSGLLLAGSTRGAGPDAEAAVVKENSFGAPATFIDELLRSART
ncbi:CE1759 family FMN reductase [Nakamurella sp. A5-74]|uniref:CE1759 family FMN reductase n=1 Tax=Nakamurella sp. A5-74 TaxID=3158264 RepID=A0AAU8DMN5_9ACTN